jgi:hypothetical protein
MYGIKNQNSFSQVNELQTRPQRRFYSLRSRVEVPMNGGCGNGSQIVGRIQAGDGEIHNLVGLDPALVDALKPLEMDYQNGG